MPQRTPPFHRALVLVSGLFFVLAACSSEAEIGESCDDEGKTEDQCVSGGVCTKDKAGGLKCLKVCNDQPDCASSEQCNGVSGSGIKACRPN